MANPHLKDIVFDSMMILENDIYNFVSKEMKWNFFEIYISDQGFDLKDINHLKDTYLSGVMLDDDLMEVLVNL